MRGDIEDESQRGDGDTVRVEEWERQEKKWEDRRGRDRETVKGERRELDEQD